MEKMKFYFKDVFGSEDKVLRPQSVSSFKVKDIVLINNKHYIITKIF